MINEEKIAVVTGASSGIGLSTALMLVEKGFKVYGCAKNKFETDKFVFIECDVTDAECVKNTINLVYNENHRIDVLVNCAGIGISGSVENTSLNYAEKLMDVNYIGTFNFTKQVLPIMRENKYGKIINIGSVAGILPIPFQTFYSASKSAIETFSRALNMEVKPFNIKVCCVMPGDAKTGFTASRVKNTVDAAEYGERINKSVAQMEKDEQNGMSAEDVSKVIVKQIMKKNTPPIVIAGFKYKFFIFLIRFFPTRFVDYLLYNMYAK